MTQHEIDSLLREKGADWRAHNQPGRPVIGDFASTVTPGHRLSTSRRATPILVAALAAALILALGYGYTLIANRGVQHPSPAVDRRTATSCADGFAITSVVTQEEADGTAIALRVDNTSSHACQVGLREPDIDVLGEGGNSLATLRGSWTNELTPSSVPVSAGRGLAINLLWTSSCPALVASDYALRLDLTPDGPEQNVVVAPLNGFKPPGCTASGKASADISVSSVRLDEYNR